MSRKKKVQPSTVEKRSILGRKKKVPNPDANKTKFDLRSNIGQNEGSQGTLFQVSKRPRSTVGPKGFSPARQDEVRAKTSINADALATGGTNWLDSRLPSTVHPDGVRRLTPESVGRRRRAVRQVQDVISQSSVPLKKYVQVSVVAPDHHMLPGKPGDTSGIYTKRPYGGTPTVHVSHETFQPSTEPGQSNRSRSSVLLHELGHAYSYATGHNRTHTGTSDAKSAKEEAYADDFSATHSPPSRGGNFTKKYPMGGRSGHFQMEYRKARNTPMSPSKPETQDNGQGRLF